MQAKNSANNDEECPTSKLSSKILTLRRYVDCKTHLTQILTAIPELYVVDWSVSLYQQVCMQLKCQLKHKEGIWMCSIVKHNVITKATCELKASKFLKAMKNDDHSGCIKATTCTKGWNKTQCDWKAAQAMYGVHTYVQQAWHWMALRQARLKLKCGSRLLKGHTVSYRLRGWWCHLVPAGHHPAFIPDHTRGAATRAPHSHHSSGTSSVHAIFQWLWLPALPSNFANLASYTLNFVTTRLNAAQPAAKSSLSSPFY